MADNNVSFEWRTGLGTTLIVGHSSIYNRSRIVLSSIKSRPRAELVASREFPRGDCLRHCSAAGIFSFSDNNQNNIEGVETDAVVVFNLLRRQLLCIALDIKQNTGIY